MADSCLCSVMYASRLRSDTWSALFLEKINGKVL